VGALTVGLINRSWCLRPASFNGAKVITFSLGTKDAETAAKRWGEVHHQVETLVVRAANGSERWSSNRLYMIAGWLRRLSWLTTATADLNTCPFATLSAWQKLA
jgi:hypothetical protein